jgi:hypothetical protein
MDRALLRCFVLNHIPTLDKNAVLNHKCAMRRKGHPSFPSAMTCCFFSSLKTLLMPKEPIRAPLGVNVPGLTMAGFQLTLHGRIWVIPEGSATRIAIPHAFL